MFGIGAGEFVVILIVGLIVFGPSKLPELGRSLGKALHAFRKAQAELSATLEETAEPPKHPTDKDHVTKKPATETTAESARVTVDDMINDAKQSPLQKQETNSTP